MALVMNASSEDQSVKVYGSWFTFKSKQIKMIDDNKAHFLFTNCAYLGFVSIPAEFEDADFKSTPEGKAQLKEIEESGIRHRCSYLETLKNNELNSLSVDMKKANDQSDPKLQMSREMIKNLTELSNYKKVQVKEDKEKVAGIDKLLKSIGE